MATYEVSKCDVCGKACTSKDLKEIRISILKNYDQFGASFDVCENCLAERPYLNQYLNREKVDYRLLLDELNEMLRNPVKKFMRWLLNAERKED